MWVECSPRATSMKCDSSRAACWWGNRCKCENLGQFAPKGRGGPAGECITTFVTSRQPTPRLDIEPAARLLGFEPVDTFPEGLPFPTAPPS
jgi:hypothetical protein